MSGNLTKDRFYSQIIKLVIPIIIQNLLSAAVNSADVVMLNYVGQSSIAAVSLAATPFVLHFAKLSETAMHYLKYMLLINTYYIMGSAVNTG